MTDIYDAPADGKDYILQVRIRNGPLMRAIRMRGFRTIAMFAEACRLSLPLVHRYLSLTSAPLNKNGEWKGSALKLAQALRLPPDSLFPEQHLSQALARSSGEMEISRDELLLLSAPDPEPTPEEELQQLQLRTRLLSAMTELTPREERLLRLRFGFEGEEKTLAEAAEIFGLSAERVRQIELRALRKLKHPQRHLTRYLGDGQFQRHPTWRQPEPKPNLYKSDFSLEEKNGS